LSIRRHFTINYSGVSLRSYESTVVYRYYDLYSSPNIIRVIKSGGMRWAGHVARMGETSGAYRVLVGKLEGKRQLARARRRWEDNIKMDTQGER
jgi:hypothetical protein